MVTELDWLKPRKRAKGHFIAVIETGETVGEVYEERDPHDGTHSWSASVMTGVDDEQWEHVYGLRRKADAVDFVENNYATKR